ncbi:MAG: hypothetical protein AAFY71_01980 [Bacteroidota bacterium]
MDEKNPLQKKSIKANRSEEGFFGEVKKFFLKEEHKVQDDLYERLNEIESLLASSDKLDKKLKPHFDKHLEEHVTYLQENYPDLFGKYMATAIKKGIKDSQEEIIDALYPIIGKLISKFLRMELEKLSQMIDQRLQDPFSFDNLKLRVKALFSGVSYEEMLITRMGRPQVEEVFLINKENGLPLGHFSIDSVTQPQAVAGMLTGIKDFVEHAFEKEDTELETLSYDKYEIILFNFETFYFATVVEGKPHAIFRKELYDTAMNFCEKHPIWVKEAITGASQAQVGEALKDHFHEINQHPK